MAFENEKCEKKIWYSDCRAWLDNSLTDFANRTFCGLTGAGVTMRNMRDK